MIYWLKMNVLWENFIQLGVPIIMFVGLAIYALIKVRNENKKNKN